MSEVSSTSRDNSIEHQGKRYVRLDKNAWNLQLEVVSLSRSATVYSSYDNVDESREGSAVVIGGVGGARRIAMMDRPDALSEEFQFVLSSGQAAGWDVPDEANRRWPAQVQCDLDMQIRRPRRWCLYVDVLRPALDKISAYASTGRLQKFTFEIYLDGLFVPEDECSSDAGIGRTAYLLPGDTWGSKVPKVSGYLSFVEIEAHLFGPTR